MVTTWPSAMRHCHMQSWGAPPTHPPPLPHPSVSFQSSCACRETPSTAPLDWISQLQLHSNVSLLLENGMGKGWFDGQGWQDRFGCLLGRPRGRRLTKLPVASLEPGSLSFVIRISRPQVPIVEQPGKSLLSTCAEKSLTHRNGEGPEGTRKRWRWGGACPQGPVKASSFFTAPPCPPTSPSEHTQA